MAELGTESQTTWLLPAVMYCFTLGGAHCAETWEHPEGTTSLTKNNNNKKKGQLTSLLYNTSSSQRGKTLTYAMKHTHKCTHMHVFVCQW